MKKIFLMRHSKAGQTDKYMLNDHERPLTEKGEQLVPELADYFNKHYKDFPPQLIISSTALRAKQTAELFKNNFKLGEPEIKEFQELYITGVDEILSVIHNIDNKIDSILMVSHNPGLHTFAIHFAKDGDKHKFREMRSNFPPGSFAAFQIDCDNWYEVNENTATLLDFVSSKNFKE